MSEFAGGPLAIATVLIRPDATKFRAELEAELRAATAKPIVVPITPVAAGRGQATAAISAQASALQAAGAAAQVEAAGLKKSASEVRATARAHEQLTRGAGASALSLFKVRGATLAASGPFLIGAAAVTLLAKSVRNFSEDQEAAFKATRVFGAESAAVLQKWAGSLANSFGLADDQAVRAAASIGNVLRVVGVPSRQAQALSEQFVELAADMATFNNVSPDDTLKALQLGLSGNMRSLRQFGVLINNAAVQEEALRETQKRSIDDLTRRDLVLARSTLILRDTARQTGSFAESQGRLGTQARITSANLDALSDSIGSGLVPILTGLLKLTNKVADGIRALTSDVRAFGSFMEGLRIPFVNAPAGDFAALVAFKAAFEGVKKPIEDVELLIQGIADPSRLSFQELLRLKAGLDAAAASAQHALTPFGALQLIFGTLDRQIRNFQATVNQISLRAAEAQIDSLGRHLLDLEFIGASSGQKIADLQATIRAAQDVLRNPAVSPGGAQADRARQTRNQAQQQIKAIQAQDKADADAAKAAAQQRSADAQAAARAAAQAAQAELDAQDQQIITAQQVAQGNVQIKQAKAQNTKSLVDDLAAAKLELAVTNRQITEAAKIHDANLRLQTIQSLTLKSIQAQGEIDRLIAEQNQRRRQAKLDAADSAVERARLDAEIASALGHKNDQIAALRRENTALEATRKLWVGNTVKQKQITLAIAQNNEEIKRLKKEKDKRDDSAKQLAFSILQERTSFVGSLLSNLLPTSAIAGTVGGTGTAISTPTGVIPRPPASTGPGPAVSAAAQVSQGAGGATAGQMNRLIQLMGQLVLIVGGKKAPPRHPEATYQTYTSSTEMAHPLN